MDTESSLGDINMSMTPIEESGSDRRSTASGAMDDKDEHDGVSNVGFKKDPSVSKLDNPTILHPRYSQGVISTGPSIGNFSAGSGGRQQAPLVLMPRPEPIPGVPAGLEYLTAIDQMLIHQHIELFEMMSGLETCNRYALKNSMGQQVYFAGEESSSMQRQCCGPQRGFVMHIVDYLGEEVIRITRQFKCFAGWNCFACLDCCSADIVIEAPIGEPIGYVKQSLSCLVPKFIIEDADRKPILRIEGPGCACRCCLPEQEFKILATSGEQVGTIEKQWGGFVKEYVSDADNFTLQFPMDMDARIKAVLIGAVFIIDFMFFENNQGAS